MSDTFTFIAPVMPRRHVDPFAVKLVTFGVVLLLLVSAFATFVVAKERSADVRHAALEAQEQAQEQANADRLASIPDAAAAVPDPITTGPVPAGVAKLLDGPARDAAERALVARARRARPRRPRGDGRGPARGRRPDAPVRRWTFDGPDDRQRRGEWPGLGCCGDGSVRGVLRGVDRRPRGRPVRPRRRLHGACRARFSSDGLVVVRPPRSRTRSGATRAFSTSVLGSRPILHRAPSGRRTS